LALFSVPAELLCKVEAEILGRNKKQKKLENPNAVKRRIPGEPVYFLRCLWEVVNDKSTDNAIYWHPDRRDAFIIVGEKLLDTTLLNYSRFKSSWQTFRRSLYLYGFSKEKNIWSNDLVDKENYDTLKLLKRKRKSNKKTTDLRLIYMEQMLNYLQQAKSMPGLPMDAMMSNPLTTGMAGMGMPQMGVPQMSGMPQMGVPQMSGMPQMQMQMPGMPQMGVPQMSEMPQMHGFGVHDMSMGMGLPGMQFPGQYPFMSSDSSAISSAMISQDPTPPNEIHIKHENRAQ